MVDETIELHLNYGKLIEQIFPHTLYFGRKGSPYLSWHKIRWFTPLGWKIIYHLFMIIVTCDFWLTLRAGPLCLLKRKKSRKSFRFFFHLHNFQFVTHIYRTEEKRKKNYEKWTAAKQLGQPFMESNFLYEKEKRGKIQIHTEMLTVNHLNVQISIGAFFLFKLWKLKMKFV